VPELPEVETVRRSLERLILGQVVMRVEVREPRLRRPLAPDFAALLTGRVIQQIKRRGKYLHFCLDDSRVWLVHLGMTGQLVIDQPDLPLLPHDHVLVFLKSGQRLRYNDTRRFGLMSIGREEEIAALTGLGVEPLSPSFTPRYLWTRSQATQRSIKDLLMDQRVVAGIGNIYASEILFRAQVRPHREAAALSWDAVARIVKATKMVLREAIRHRGSSISDYLDGEGNPGGFQERFRVYDREGQPCRECRVAIRRETRGGRSTFFCPTCQY
jgi:formamidopyrimidine-DNA glycosylase